MLIKFPTNDSYAIFGKIPGNSFPAGTQIQTPGKFYVYAYQDGKAISCYNTWHAGVYDINSKNFSGLKSKGLFKKTYETELYFINTNPSNHDLHLAEMDRTVKTRDGKTIKYTLSADITWSSINAKKMIEMAKAGSLKPDSKDGVILRRFHFNELLYIFLDEAIESVHHLKLPDTFCGRDYWDISKDAVISNDERKAVGAVEKVFGDRLQSIGFEYYDSNKKQTGAPKIKIKSFL